MMRRYDFDLLPALVSSVEDWSNTLLKKAQQLSEDCNMSLAEVLNMPLSFEAMYYKSSAWPIRKKAKEDQHHLLASLNARLDVLIRSR